MVFPVVRSRRLRSREAIRRLVRETRLSVDDLVMPLFVVPGRGLKQPIRSMPGLFRFSVENAVKEVGEIVKQGIGAVLLFGIPAKKDDRASEAYAPHGIIQQAVAAIKNKSPDLVVMTDVCLCEYMSHGHCGVVDKQGRIDNDASIALLAATALSQVAAGADIVAPSAMMDGQVRTIRQALDQNNFQGIPILSYAVKYASAAYGPFREAAESPPAFGDRRSYQIDPANGREALREAKLDIDEGADIIMVKPALTSLDILARLRERVDTPLAAFNVSGEYAMVKAAAAQGWIDEATTIREHLTSIKRAGADIVVSYFAKEIASQL